MSQTAKPAHGSRSAIGREELVERERYHEPVAGWDVVATKASLRPGDFELGSLESRAAARALAEPQHRLATNGECEVYPTGWSAKNAAQKTALESATDILFFGSGAAGSLKTETILVDAIRERNNPNLRAIIFR